MTQEARDLRRVLDQMIDIVGEVTFDEHIAGEEFAFCVDAAAATHFNDLFSRHEDFFKLVGKIALHSLIADRLGDLVLEIRVSVNDVPAGGHDGDLTLSSDS